MSKLFNPEEWVLSNGIPVIFQHFDGAVASTYWWVRTGSGDERASEAGFAHFLEHMLFKDAAAKETGHASVGQMARAIESLGGDINAYTSFDQTVYHVTCSSHHWEKVIDQFGAMARPQHFLREDFEKEREVIIEELRKNEDSPERKLFQSLFSLTFKKHPYGKPVIGTLKSLKAAKVGSLEAFYNRNYVSSKMGLVLVGSLDSQGKRKKEIVKVLEKHFGNKVLRKKESHPFIRASETELRNGAFTAVEFDVKTPSLALSFRVPELKHPDIPALDLLGGILGSGELSRLYQQLFYGSSLVTEVGGGLYVPSDPGMLFFQAETDSMSKLNPACEAMLKELKRICSDGPTDEELNRVIVNAESERLYATQTADGMAGRIGFLKFILGDLSFDQKYLEELRAVDSARIKEVAQKYLNVRRMSGVVMLSKGEAGFDIGEIKEISQKILAPEEIVSKLARERIPQKVAKGSLMAETFKLPSGVRVAFLDRPNSQVFSIHAAVMGGVRLELARPIESAENDWGSSHMMALTWTKGTSGKNANAISAIVEGHAAGMEGFSGRNSVGLQLTGLARDWGKLSELFSEVFLGPVFPEDEVQHSRRISEDSVRSIEDHSAQLATKLFLETLFEKHPYRHLTIGSLQSLSHINQRKLKLFHSAWVRPDRVTLSMSGPLKRSTLESWLSSFEKAIGTLQNESGIIDLPLSLPEEEPLKSPRWVEKKLGREQTHIIVGGLGTHIYAEDRFAMRLLQTLLGGQSGRLFIELREKKSLAYSVSPMSFEGIERGYVGTYIGCAPQKKEEAILGIQEVLRKLAERGPTPAEMSRAKEFYLGRRAMDLQSDASLAAHFGLEVLFGLPTMSQEEVVRKVKAVTSKDIQNSCRKYLVDAPQVTCVVG